MPRPWLDTLQAVAPWIACGIAAVALLCVLAGCSDSTGAPATEHPEHGAWYAVGDALPGGYYLIKAHPWREPADPRDIPPGYTEEQARHGVVVIADAPLSAWVGPTGRGPVGAHFWAVWVRDPLPHPWMGTIPLWHREYTDDTATDWWLERGSHAGLPPCGVLVYEIEPGRARVGLVW